MLDILVVKLCVSANAKAEIQILLDSILDFLLDNCGGEIFFGFFYSGVNKLG